jgi:hypothetical protein
VIKKSNFSNSEVSGSESCGGAIYGMVELKGEMRIVDSKFVNCKANEVDGYGGGIYLYLNDHAYEYFLKNLSFNGMGAKYGKHIFVSMDNLTSVAGKQFGGLFYFILLFCLCVCF